MSFKKNKYKVVRQAITKQLTDFIFHYFQNKRRVSKILFDSRYISPFTEYWGTWDDGQIPKTYSHYADGVFETLLEGLHERVEKETGYKLYPSYSYARIYKKGDILKRHRDRDECEISGTIHIGGDTQWPIYLSEKSNRPGKKVILAPGDLLLYKACDLEHWREPFEGNTYCQGFIHYTDSTQPNALKLKYDGRVCAGLPAWFKDKKVKGFR